MTNTNAIRRSAIAQAVLFVIEFLPTVKVSGFFVFSPSPPEGFPQITIS